MQQTLLALLALMMVTFLNYSQMKANLQDQKQVVRAEMEQMAVGVAMQTLEVIRARAYDDETIGVDKDSISSASEFTDTFPTGNHCTAFGGTDTCDDIDDFNEMVPATVSFDTPQFKMKFKVEAQVQYVDKSMNPVSDETYRKKVTLRVQDVGDNPSINESIQYSEVLTFY